MDEIAETAFHALRIIGRFVLQTIAEGLIEHLLSPLFEVVAAIYRGIRDVLRHLFRFDLIAIPLATLAIIAIAAGPLFILGKVAEWLVGG
jgi:hypothetical protein